MLGDAVRGRHPSEYLGRDRRLMKPPLVIQNAPWLKAQVILASLNLPRRGIVVVSPAMPMELGGHTPDARADTDVGAPQSARNHPADMLCRFEHGNRCTGPDGGDGRDDDASGAAAYHDVTSILLTVVGPPNGPLSLRRPAARPRVDGTHVAASQCSLLRHD